MNDYKKGTIDCCFELSKTSQEFIANIKKTTGLTEVGIAKDSYIQKKIQEKMG